MTAKNRVTRVFASRSWWAVVVLGCAMPALGADRPESWRDVAAFLPAITVPPDAPVRMQAIDNGTGSEPVPISRPPAVAVGKVVAVAADDPEPPAAPAGAPRAPTSSSPVPSPTAKSADVPAAVVHPTPRVYVINGIFLFRQTGFSAMVEQIRDRGFPETRSVPWWQTFRFARDIRRRERETPGTAVVVIGYSFGAYRAKALASRLTRDGIPVAMVGYVGGDYLRNSPESIPAGIRVVNVTGNGFLLSGRNLFFDGTELWGAENLRLNVRHIDLPSQPQTVDALISGIYASTGSYPATTVVASSPRSGTPEPAFPSHVVGSPPVRQDR